MGYKSISDYYYNTNPIGKGSFSIIYKGYYIIDKKPIAIKKIKYMGSININSEIDIMKKINHPNILKLYDVVEYKNNIYLVLEYCNQGDLQKYIESKETCYNDDYIKQILNGLHYLYKKNIIHRDIKPNNILIHNNIIKICDFGFSKEIENNDILNTFCGSPLYMAPEIFKLHEYSIKSDIWSLGVIIYEIIYKKHPYPSNNKITLLQNIENNIIIPNECKYKYLLERMLDKNEYTRISWEELFDLFYKNMEKEEPVENKMITSSNSLYLKSKPIKINLNKSVIEKKNISYPSTLIYNEKIYSSSAPDKTNYIENYMNIKIQESYQNDYSQNGYTILPTNQSELKNHLYNIVNSSVKTLKYYLNL